MTQILIASNPEHLRAYIAPYARAGTVEAEYGDVLVEGHSDQEDDQHTLAHHGPRHGNLAPCLANNRAKDLPVFNVIGLSHADLDALGGVLAFLGRHPTDDQAEKFWRLAAWVDVHGPHRMREWGTDVATLDRLYAWWAWAAENRLNAPRDGSVMDCTRWVHDAEAALRRILAGQAQMIAAGLVFRQREGQVNADSFLGNTGGVVERCYESFVNHMYVGPDNVLALCCVAYNATMKTVTVSLAEPIEGVSCCDVVQALWGMEAGGHKGIAGSPRGQEMKADDAKKAAAVMRCVLAGRRTVAGMSLVRP